MNAFENEFVDSSDFDIQHLDKSNEYGIKKKYTYDERFRNTEDYTLILSTLNKLRNQREQVIEEINALTKFKEEILVNPNMCNDRIMEWKKEITSTKRPKIIDVPNIDISKYESLKDKNVEMPVEGEIIRGRKYTSKKSLTFNRLWTPEEQLKLEKLLEEYPEESVASHRYEKIARALGNRTPKQVASRVQKYFIRMAKAGLQVPGKMPNMEIYTEPKSKVIPLKRKINPTTVTVHTRHIDYFEAPRVKIDDEDEDDKESNSESSDKKKNKIEEFYISSENTDPNGHYGIFCNSCHVDPIIGSRWTCSDCIYQVNFCSNCKDKGWTSDKHLESHTLEEVKSTRFFDEDYNSCTSTNESQYLDFNFLPL